MTQAIARRIGALPAIVLDAPAPETPGSVAWVAEAVFGGQRPFEEMLQAIVVGQGAAGEPRWRELVSAMMLFRKRGESYNLNQLCITMGIPFGELLGFIGEGVREVQAGIALMKASLAAPQVIDYSLIAAMDPDNGRGDREMLLKVAGVLQDKSGVSVNVNQQVGIKVGKDELLTPLKQFSQVATEIDNTLRNVVDAEILE